MRGQVVVDDAALCHLEHLGLDHVEEHVAEGVPGPRAPGGGRGLPNALDREPGAAEQGGHAELV
eukprot:7442257-Lingulodinium_polyedra.AAC.1